jgi:hypothetical protein
MINHILLKLKIIIKFTIMIHCSCSLVNIFYLNSSYFSQNFIDIIDIKRFTEKKFPMIINNIYKDDAHLLLFKIGAPSSADGEFINCNIKVGHSVGDDIINNDTKLER